jgi:hypothetical protein
MTKTNEFMMLFRFEPSNDYQPTAAEMEASQQQWGAFIGNLAIQEKLVSTHQLGFEGNQISADQTVTEGIYISTKQTLGGNMIIKAKNLKVATEIAKDCPILAIGGSVEIRSITPM